MKIDLNKFAKCANCARWTKPLDTSACKLSEKETLPFKKNDQGEFYCDDFVIVFS